MSHATIHPWIKFQLDLQELGPIAWMALGECTSKATHLRKAPLAPEVAKQLQMLYLAKGVLATTAIEGNTLTEEEVLRRLNGETVTPKSRRYLQQEVDNIAKSCNEILDLFTQGKGINLDRQRICTLNAQVLNALELEEGVVPGAVRKIRVGVGRYLAAPPEHCEELLDRLSTWLASDAFSPPQDHHYPMAVAILKAIIAHLYLAWIHPFGDGNGRTARLVEFQILIEAGMPAPAAHLLSNHYNRTRSEYYRLLDLSSKDPTGPIKFVTYALQGLRDGLQEQVEIVWQNHYDIVWKNHVFQSLSDAPGAVEKRRRTLLLELTRVGPTTRDAIPLASPLLAQLYPPRSVRTLARDILVLRYRGLVVQEKDKLRANTELVLKLLPVSRAQEK